MGLRSEHKKLELSDLESITIKKSVGKWELDAPKFVFKKTEHHKRRKERLNYSEFSKISDIGCYVGRQTIFFFWELENLQTFVWPGVLEIINNTTSQINGCRFVKFQEKFSFFFLTPIIIVLVIFSVKTQPPFWQRTILS